MKTHEILKEETITYKNVLLLKRRINNGEKISLQDLEENPKLLIDYQKGIDFLLNSWKTPKGQIRKNNPFGWVQTEVLENFNSIEFGGFKNIGNKHFDNYVPLWVVNGDNTDFVYYMQGGVIYIIN